VTVDAVLRILRNALAHGSLFTRGAGPGRPDDIRAIVFVSVRWEKNDKGRYAPTDTFDVLSCPPEDLRRLIFRWVDFLESLPLPALPSAEGLDFAPQHS
jgi:hypothetical protein